MQEYELMFVLTTDLDDEGVEAATQNVSSLVTSRGGEVIGIEPWGRRRLAYPIQNHLDGVYSVMRLRVDSEAVVPIERGLKLNESVLRHLLTRPGN